MAIQIGNADALGMEDVNVVLDLYEQHINATRVQIQTWYMANFGTINCNAYQNDMKALQNQVQAVAIQVLYSS